MFRFGCNRGEQLRQFATRDVAYVPIGGDFQRVRRVARGRIPWYTRLRTTAGEPVENNR